MRFGKGSFVSALKGIASTAISAGRVMQTTGQGHKVDPSYIIGTQAYEIALEMCGNRGQWTIIALMGTGGPREEKKLTDDPYGDEGGEVKTRKFTADAHRVFHEAAEAYMKEGEDPVEFLRGECLYPEAVEEILQAAGDHIMDSLPVWK